MEGSVMSEFLDENERIMRNHLQPYEVSLVPVGLLHRNVNAACAPAMCAPSTTTAGSDIAIGAAPLLCKCALHPLWVMLIARFSGVSCLTVAVQLYGAMSLKLVSQGFEVSFSQLPADCKQ
jgi:hypothetical protein